jgi:hypothetical protein
MINVLLLPVNPHNQKTKPKLFIYDDLQFSNCLQLFGLAKDMKHQEKYFMSSKKFTTANKKLANIIRMMFIGVFIKY